MFDFPSSPAPGQTFTTGGITYMWNGYAWMGGGVAQVPTEQFFQLDGLAQLDIPVPAWAKQCVINGVAYVSASNYALARISGDGSTFAAGASDYNVGGPSHATGSGGYATAAPAGAAFLQLTMPADNAVIPQLFTFDLSLARPNTSAVFHGKMYSKGFDSAAANQLRTGWLASYVNTTATTSLTVKALRVAVATGAFAPGSFVSIKWLGDTSQLAIGNWAAANLPRSYLAGLTLSNNVTTPNSKIDVAPGQCRDDTNTVNLVLPFGTIDFTTIGPNGLDAGALAATAWYHVFAIGKPDTTVARFGSLSLTPTLPAGYTFKRRIGSVRTGGAATLNAFKQIGDTFFWTGGNFGEYTGAGTASAWAALSLTGCPPGVVVQPMLTGYFTQSSATGTTSVEVHFDSLPTPSGAPAMVGFTSWQSQTVYFNLPSGVFTDTLKQVRWLTNMAGGGTGSFAVYSRGYQDRRGRDD